jgi:hypothetical protein
LGQHAPEAFSCQLAFMRNVAAPSSWQCSAVTFRTLVKKHEGYQQRRRTFDNTRNLALYHAPSKKIAAKRNKSLEWWFLHRCNMWLYFWVQDAVSVDNQIPKFRCNIMLFFSRLQILKSVFRNYLPCRLGHYVVSKRREQVSQWRGVKFQKYGILGLLCSTHHTLLYSKKHVPVSIRVQ